MGAHTCILTLIELPDKREPVMLGALYTPPHPMSYFGHRRSPSLESIGSVTSMLSSSDENSPGVSIQDPDPAFGLLPGQNEQSHEREGMRSATPFTDDGDINPGLAPPAPPDGYPTHKHFYFPAENIYFLVSTCCIRLHSVLIRGI